MNPRYLFRACLGLLVVALLVAGGLATGIVGPSRDSDSIDAEPIASVTDAPELDTTSTEDPAIAARLAEEAAAERAAAEQAQAEQAAAEHAAAEQAAAEQAQAEQAAQAQAQARAKAEADRVKAANDAAAYKKQQEKAFYEGLQRQADQEAAAAKAKAQAPAPAPKASPRPAGVPDDSYWDRMAKCETGGNWSMTGHTYSGGVGFANTTWNAWGRREFAPNAGQATRDQQIIVANRVATQGHGKVAAVGYSGWGCVRTIGYP